jgi:hypothetical protein
MKKITDFFKKIYQKIKLEQIAIVAVIVTQSLKRLVTSEFALIVLELAPLPWVSFITKILRYISKANEVLPVIIKNIVLAKGLLDNYTIDNQQLTDVLVKHLRGYSKEELNEFFQYFALQVSIALDNDGLIDDVERKDINDKVYQKLFKIKQ